MYIFIDYIVGLSRSVPYEFTLKEFCFDDEGEDLIRNIWHKDKAEITGMRLADNSGRTVKTFVKGGIWIG